MTSPEILSSELAAFCARRDAKFAEICKLLAEQLGMGEPGSLNDQQRSAIASEAEEAIENWQADSHSSDAPAANAPLLQRLLAEYCEIEREIIKREDEIAARADDLDDDDGDD